MPRFFFYVWLQICIRLGLLVYVKSVWSKWIEMLYAIQMHESWLNILRVKYQTSRCVFRWRRFMRTRRGCRPVSILWTFWPWTLRRTTTCTSSPFTGSLASLTSTLLTGMFNSFSQPFQLDPNL